MMRDFGEIWKTKGIDSEKKNNNTVCLMDGTISSPRISKFTFAFSDLEGLSKKCTQKTYFALTSSDKFFGDFYQIGR